MPKTTRKTIIASITKATTTGPVKAKQALETVLGAIRTALGEGKHVDLGKPLGKLKVVARKPSRRINGNLKHRKKTIEDVCKRHPRTVRLVRGQDLSENPLPTVVHKREKPEVQPPARRPIQVAVAIPSWRKRFR